MLYDLKFTYIFLFFTRKNILESHDFFLGGYEWNHPLAKVVIIAMDQDTLDNKRTWPYMVIFKFSFLNQRKKVIGSLTQDITF